jgi:thiosulfate dehydrogenase
MRWLIIYFIILLILLGSNLYAQMRRGMHGESQQLSPQQYLPTQDKWLLENLYLVRGGQLYDDWWRTTVDTTKPEGEQSLWKKQASNKRKGYATYRCKECHGWDYRGKDGAYGKGSHYTGFIGVYQAGKNMIIEQLEAALKGSTNKDHDFSKFISEDDIADLALFMRKGLIDTVKLVNNEGIPRGGNIRTGGYLFQRNCMHMCHGGWGTAINFGDSEKPEFVGTIAYKNPWEFIHKVRVGQPGTRMPSAILNEWSEKDILNLLSFARTLPKDSSEVNWGRGWGRKGMMGMHHRDYAPGRGRGFGPSLE